MQMATDRTALRDAAIASLTKAYGAGIVSMYGDKPVKGIECYPSGSLSLDHIVLGVGGFPKGRIIEIFGPESSGKTTLSLHAIAEVQKAGGTAAFVDVEHALDPKYAARLGVDMPSLLISQPDYGEQALEVTETLVSSGAVDIVVVDSVAALVPKAEIEGEMGDHHVGVHARLMSQAMRKLTGLVGKHKVILIFINQIRHKIGVMYGSPETTTGGNALKFYASIRLDIRRIGSVGEKKDGKVDMNTAVGNRVRVKAVKNKVSPPFREAEFDIMFGQGVNRLGELLDFGVTYDVIEQSGSWYSFQGEKIGQGRDKALATIEADSEMRAAIEQLVYAHFNQDK